MVAEPLAVRAILRLLRYTLNVILIHDLPEDDSELVMGILTLYPYKTSHF